MARVDADPSELRQTAAQLRQFKSELESQLGRMNGRVSTMRNGDAQQRKFADEWDRIAQSMRSFLTSIESHAPYLDRKAKQLEEYLR